MSAFTVELENQPGEPARLCEAVAARDVNLFLPVRISDEQLLAVICVDDIDAASEALGDQVVTA